MHILIRIICYANDEKEARERAEEILNDNLVGEWKPFDYGTFFDNNSSSVSGQSRFGKIAPVSLANSKEGKKLINEGMKFTKYEFKRSLKKIKEMINDYNDEELFEGKILSEKSKIIENLENKQDNFNIGWFKFFCSNLGEYSGNNIYLYDDGGSGIRSNRDLKDVLNNFGETKQKVYIIPIDVHY